MDASVDALLRKRTFETFVIRRSSAAVATQSIDNANATTQANERITVARSDKCRVPISALAATPPPQASVVRPPPCLP